MDCVLHVVAKSQTPVSDFHFHFSPLLLGVTSGKKNPPANAGGARDAGSIPESGRSPRGGNVPTLQFACLGNPMNRGAWWATVHGITESDTTE